MKKFLFFSLLVSIFFISGCGLLPNKATDHQATESEIVQDFPGEGDFYEEESYIDAYLGFKIEKFPIGFTHTCHEEGDDYVLRIFDMSSNQVGEIVIRPWTHVDSLALTGGGFKINGTPAKKESTKVPQWGKQMSFVLYEMESIENSIIVSAILQDDLTDWFEENWFFLKKDVLADKAYDIHDLYLMLPDEYLLCDNTSSIRLDEYKKKVDLENGYIIADPGYPLEIMVLPGENEYFQVAVLVECGEGCMCNRLDVLTLEGVGVWKDSHELIPNTDQLEEGLAVFRQMDQYTKSIVVFSDETGEVVYRLEWTGERFEVKK